MTARPPTQEPDHVPELHPEDLPEPVPQETNAYDYRDQYDEYDDYDGVDDGIDSGTDDGEQYTTTGFEPAPFVTHSYEKSQFHCTRCGSTNLARGYVVDYGDKFEQVRFAPKRVKISWLNSLFNLRPWRRLIKLEAEACRDCGAVIMIVDPSALRRAEKRRD